MKKATLKNKKFNILVYLRGSSVDICSILAHILSDLISIQISALVLYYLRRVREGGGDVTKKVRVFGLKTLFLKRFTVRSTTRTLITDKNDHSAFTAIIKL